MTWTKQGATNTSWGNDSAGSSAWSSGDLYGFLLMEDGGYLLQETGGYIRLNQASDPDWSEPSHSGSWAKVTPNATVWT